MSKACGGGRHMYASTCNRRQRGAPTLSCGWTVIGRVKIFALRWSCKSIIVPKEIGAL